MIKLAFKDDSVRLTASMLQDDRLIRILVALLETAPEMGGDVVIVTSARDGGHRRGSRHYIGLAIDVRAYGNRPGAPVNEAPSAWVARLKQFLGPNYDVILEPDHVHIEWDRK